MIMPRRVLLLMLWIGLATGYPVAAGAKVSQLHLSWQHDPATTMTVLWATDKNHAPPKVEYGTTPSYGSVVQGSDTTHGVSLHTVELTGLQADSRYHYRVSDDDGGWSQDMTFHTAPLPGQTGQDGLIVTLVGDKGPYSDAQAVNAQIATKNADLHLIVGDLAYSSDDAAFHAWLDKQQGYAQSAPLMPAWGNHDTTEKDPPYSDSQAHFALPTDASADERFYSYDVGNTHFVAVDSNTDNSTAPGSPQYEWLQKDLAAASTRASIRWIVVYFHHNIYSAGGKYADTETPVRAHFQPLFDQYGVDLVLHGHNHYYSRSMPVAYNEGVKNATRTTSYNFSEKDHGQIYITAGGGGKPLYPCPKELPSFILRCDSVYSFGLLTIHGARLVFQAFRSDGALLDEGFTLVKSADGISAPPPPDNTAIPVESEDKMTAEKKNVEEVLISLEDAMVHEAYPEKNYGHAVRMEVDRIEAGGQKEVYLKFQVPDFSEPITGVSLQLKTADLPFADSDSAGLLYTVSDSSWTEGALTWKNRPKREASPLPNAPKKGVGRNEMVIWDLTGVITGPGLYSFALASGSSNGVIYNTKESEAGKPALMIMRAGGPADSINAK